MFRRGRGTRDQSDQPSFQERLDQMPATEPLEGEDRSAFVGQLISNGGVLVALTGRDIEGASWSEREFRVAHHFFAGEQGVLRWNRSHDLSDEQQQHLQLLKDRANSMSGAPRAIHESAPDELSLASHPVRLTSHALEAAGVRVYGLINRDPRMADHRRGAFSLTTATIPHRLIGEIHMIENDPGLMLDIYRGSFGGHYDEINPLQDGDTVYLASAEFTGIAI